MKVLMFGWEFPPLSSGGLGTACYGLTKGLSDRGIEITFVVPYLINANNSNHIKLISAGNVKIRRISSALHPYISSHEYKKFLGKTPSPKIYGSTLFDEVYRYTLAADKIAEEEDFDIIHCHDWMTFGAGARAKEKRNKPLVVHVHSTEFDRTGRHHVNQYVYDLEKQGMHKADKIIAVSNLTKNKLISHYGVSSEQIEIVHNAVDFSQHVYDENFEIKRTDRVVLFLGRLTLQKGPDYFVYAAKKVLEQMKNVKFVVAGTGDMEPFIIEKVAELGIADKILFAGFLNEQDVERAYKMADVYVMPSVSDPFGITALEAMKNKTPLIVSKQSGVSEVIRHCLKIDFWDIDEISNKIISLLRYKPLHETMKDNAYFEVKKFNWDTPAEKCIEIYNGLISNGCRIT
ncbi:MAG: glycosyltransferase family 4 protein [Nanoarchaeota archaeon]